MKFCPSCGEDIAKYLSAESGHPTAHSVATLPTAGKYDAVATWKALLSIAEGRQATPPSTAALVSEALTGMKPGGKKTVVHIAFVEEIVPRGGVLYRAALLEGRNEMDVERFKKMGYAVDREGHLVVVDDMPVGEIYQALQYWGGDRQHKRWHLKYPVEVNPARNGDLYFMDNNIVAFGAEWSDTSKMDEALNELLNKTVGIGLTPLALELVTL